MNIATILLISLSLSIDAFIVMYFYTKINKGYLNVIPIIIGIMHFVLPITAVLLVSIFDIGENIIPTIVVSTIYIYLGINAYKNRNEEVELSNKKSVAYTLLISFTVSIDSFLIGISIGLNSNPVLIPAIFFGCISAFFTALSIYVSKKDLFIPNKNSQAIAGLFFIGLGIVNFISYLV